MANQICTQLRYLLYINQYINEICVLRGGGGVDAQLLRFCH